MNLVIVESPAKAKTIEKYLGKDYKVLASFGHIRDLPSKTGSVRPDEDFAMDWAVDTRAKKRITDIVNALKTSDKLILATDPDREGEAISWHLLEVLEKKKALKGKAVERVVFNAITKKSVTDAIKAPRELDMQLVNAYLARRALDYLVGFTLSPVLWRKLPGSRSAGRVQSVSLRLITERETEIEQFQNQEYWTVEADIASTKGNNFPAKLVSLSGDKLTKFSLGDEKAGHAARDAVKAASLSITSVIAKPVKRNPLPPYTTSTLQQDASGRLGFSATRTMQTAQKLYEGIDIGGETVGLITYMRTDGVSMVGEAISEARSTIKNKFGDKYVPEKVRIYKSKAKNAQEAHEAIRPTSFTRTPADLNLSGDQAKLYELIWNRAMASQMATAQLERTTIEIADTAKTVGLRASGTVVRFDGYLVLYRERAKKDEESTTLPPVAANDMVVTEKIEAEQHFTQPPPRYSEASLVKKMEELGIGRPSTYASILKVLQDRDYVTLDKRRFIPADKGRLVIAFLEEFFTKYVQYDYTAELEERLDKVSDGKLEWKKLLANFWDGFSAQVDGTKDLRVSQVLDALNVALGPMVFPEKEDGSDPRKCPTCDDGQLSLKVSRFGSFVGCTNYPDCKHTRPFGKNGGDAAPSEDKVLGVDPDSGLDVWLKTGRYGPYVQLGEDKKPKRTGLPKEWPYDDIDLFKGLKLLSLPRHIGDHPEDGKKIVGAIGRYGPYILHAGVYANLKTADEMFEVGINRAVTLIAEKIAKRGGGAGALKELGDHPETKKPIKVMAGRYGPYVKYAKINATIPKDVDPQDVTLEMALEYIAAKEAKGAKKKKPAKKKKAAPKKKKAAAKKKPAAKKKKPAAKTKTAPKK
ncbi:MAG: type I DNA topoisomerase [Robiginitomaculum sp.]|nr:type I DNA topoisomerase [Robiginitomaculum sp.]